MYLTFLYIINDNDTPQDASISLFLYIYCSLFL